MSNPSTKAKAGKKAESKKQPAAAAKESAAKPKAGAIAAEPNDVDEYETMRQAAVEPFRRSNMPKPGAAGRLFDDEEELEDYDPLFDDVGEESDE
ncbi:MAG: hypothetical protein H6841_00730 [Planctomycetes bacterium]|nr:hypothetical protein [Planctomycetota bacterium]